MFYGNKYSAKDGVETTQIELADKILDRDGPSFVLPLGWLVNWRMAERIRNTLSHEMCHLATWIIDKTINEHHGPNFKKW
jgi:hypothetical protein